MAVLSSKLVVSLIDHVTGPARRMQASLAGVYGVGGKARGIGGMGAAMGAQLAQMRRHSGAATAAAMPLAMIGRSGFQAAYGLEKVMNNIEAVGMLTEQQRGTMKAYIQDLNKLFPFVNREIGEAAFELFRAGFNFDQAMGALRGTLLLAQAGDIDRQQAADIATNVLTAMRLPMQTTEQAAASMARVNDVLAYAANRSNTDVRLLGETFKYVAPLASSAGMSLDGVAAAAMTMANNGIKGSEAGIAMRSALVRMAKPTKDMRATLDRLNINLSDFITGGREITSEDVISGLMQSGVDASGQRKAIETMLKDDVLRLKPGQLVANLVDLVAKEAEGAADKSVLAETIGDILTASGQNYDLLGFTGALREKGVGVAEISRIMDIRQGARVLTMLLADLKALERDVAVRSAGAAQRMADTRMKGIVGQVARLQAAWENLFVTIGDAGVLDTIGGMFDKLASGLQSLAQSSPLLLQIGTGFLAFLAVIGPLGILLGGVVSAFRMLGAGIKLALSPLTVLLSKLSALMKVAPKAAPLFSMAAGAAAGGAVAKAASKGMIAGMGGASAAAASGAMIAGMSSAGAAAAAKGSSKLGMLGKLGAKGMGRLFLPLGVGLAAWDAWQGYQKDGIKGAILNPLTLGLYSAGDAQAAPAGAQQPGPTNSAAGDLERKGAQAQQITATVRTAMDQVRSIVGAVNLEAEGRRIMDSMARGMRAGIPAIQSAASAAAAAASHSALRGAYSDAGR